MEEKAENDGKGKRVRIRIKKKKKFRLKSTTAKKTKNKIIFALLVILVLGFIVSLITGLIHLAAN